MLTQEQIHTIKEYKQALEKYNTGTITYQEYVEQTLPLWNKLNILFEKNQKTR